MSAIALDVVFGVVFACNLVCRLTSADGHLTSQKYDTSHGGFA